MEKPSRLKTPTADTDVSALLRAWSGGDQDALQALTPIVYAELRRLARSYMRRERSWHSLQATALVNEAYMRLADYTRMQWQDRAHFFAVSAQVMRRILVDHARARAAAKRDARATIALDEATVATAPTDIDLLALDAALDKLGRLDPRQGRLVELRFFAGLTVEETATALGVAPITVHRDWALARAWLFRELQRRVS